MEETNTRLPPRSGEIADGEDLVSLPSGYGLARYQLLETLGQGAFGITYRAHDQQLDRTVAIKEYLPAALAVRHGGTQVLPRSTRLADDFRWGRDRFLAEAQTLARFENVPAVVRVYDFLEANGTAYMVMELLRGETLETRLRREGRLSQSAVETLLHPLLDGLERVHATSVLHRDIKPSNIMLDDEGHPTLLDFGAARAAIAGRTTALTAVYTPGYAAAEQFTSATQGPYTDIYALAATLYQCVTGSQPPTALERLLEDKLVPAAKAAAGNYAPKLLAGIDAGLALKAQDRPQTTAGWRQYFAGSRPTFAPGPQAAALPPDEVKATRVSRRGEAPRAPQRAGARPWLMAAALVLLLGGGAVGGYVYVEDLRQARLEEEQRKAEEARKRAEEEALRQARLEEERRQAEEARRQAEAEAARQRELEEQRRAEEERQRAEQARLQAEEEARRRAAEEEAARQAQLEAETQSRRQEEARRQAAEEARRRQEEEARRQAELEARRRQEEEARRAGGDEARRRAEAEARRQQEEAGRRQQEDARRQAAEEARRRSEAEARRRQEEAARRQQEEAARRPAGVEGLWVGTVDCHPGGPKGAVNLRIAGGQGNTTVQGMQLKMRLSETSAVADLAWIGEVGLEWMASLRGRPAGDALAIEGSARTIGGRRGVFNPHCRLNLRRQ